MRTPTLQSALAGAERAAERVRRWPSWMLALSPRTAHVLEERQRRLHMSTVGEIAEPGE